MGTLLWLPFITGGICFILATTEPCFGDDDYFGGDVFQSNQQ